MRYPITLNYTIRTKFTDNQGQIWAATG